MRPLPRRRPSKTAKWALRIAVFLPILACMSVIAHRTNSVDTPSFLILLVLVAFMVFLALFFVFLAMRSLWVKGKRGGRRTAWAFFLCALVLGPYIFGAALWVTRPQVTDVATDLINPPVFASEVDAFGSRAAAIVASELVDSYPDLNGRRYNGASETVLDQILSLADNRGWQMTSRRGRIGADDELAIAFTSRSFVLAMPMQISARLTDEGDSTFFDMRSKSVYGSHDLGANAALIRRFIADLDFALIGQLEE